MWETPFETSMLKNSSVVIHCPDGSNAESLMEILANCGVKWCTGESPLTANNCWDVEKEDTVYYIENRVMSYGDIKITNNRRRYVRCTFYGVESPDFDVASDDEFRSLLGI